MIGPRRLRGRDDLRQDPASTSRGVLEAIVKRLPPPKGDAGAPLKALLVDSWYDAYLGVVVLVRVIDGSMKKGSRIRMMGTDAHYEVERIGVFKPKNGRRRARSAQGEIGFITAQIKEVADTRVGDTITDERKPTADRPARLQAGPAGGVLRPVSGRRGRFRGFAAPPWVGCGSTTRASPSRWRVRRRSASVSAAAFSGLLHLEIIQERLEREFNLDLIATAPSVIYKIELRDGTEIELHNPADMPDVDEDRPEITEPWIRATMLTPDELSRQHPESSCQDRRGTPGRPELRRQARHGHLRSAAERGGLRLLR